MEKKPSRPLSWVAVLLVVCLICGAAYLTARQIVAARTSLLRDAIEVTAKPGQAIAPLGDGMIYYDGTTLHALDARGRQIWSYSPGSGAEFDVGDGGVAVWAGENISLLNAETGATLFSGPVESAVLSARLGETYSAVQTGTEHNSVMLILDSAGRQVDRIELNSQTVLDFGFFSGGTLFWVMSLNTEGTLPICSISTYRPGKMLTGTIYDSQQVIYEVLFQSSQIRAVGTTHIKEYDYTGKENAGNRMLVYGWYLMDLDQDQAEPLMVFAPNDQADGSQPLNDVRMIRGQQDCAVRLPYAASQVFARGDKMYAFSGSYVMVTQMGNAVPDIYTLPVPVSEVMGVTQAGAAIVSSGSAVYMVPLP